MSFFVPIIKSFGLFKISRANEFLLFINFCHSTLLYTLGLISRPIAACAEYREVAASLKLTFPIINTSTSLSGLSVPRATEPKTRATSIVLANGANAFAKISANRKFFVRYLPVR